MKVYNPNIHFSNIHFWLFWRRQWAVASTLLSTRGGGERKKRKQNCFCFLLKMLYFY